MRIVWLHAGLLTGALVATGCQTVPVARSAATPGLARPIRTTKVAGDAAVGGAIAVADVQTKPTPQDGDPGLWIPRRQGSAYFRVPVVAGLSVGGHVQLARFDSASPTFEGLHAPDAGVIFGTGPEVAYTHRFGNSVVGLGATWSLSLAMAPWAELRGDPDGGEATRETGTGLAPLTHFAAGLHLYPAEGLVLEAGAAIQNHVTNVAFDAEASSGGLGDRNGNLEADAIGGVPYATVRYVTPSGWFAAGQVLVPLGFGRIDVKPIAGAFTVGIELGYGEGQADSRSAI